MPRFGEVSRGLLGGHLSLESLLPAARKACSEGVQPHRTEIKGKKQRLSERYVRDRSFGTLRNINNSFLPQVLPTVVGASEIHRFLQ